MTGALAMLRDSLIERNRLKLEASAPRPRPCARKNN